MALLYDNHKIFCKSGPRSASTEQIDVSFSHRSMVRYHAFLVAGVKVWSSLYADVAFASSLPVFKNRLKTYLFCCCYDTLWLWHFSDLFLLLSAVVLVIVLTF